MIIPKEDRLLEEVREHLNKELEDKQKLVKALRAFERATKKDGSDYKDFRRNFVNKDYHISFEETGFGHLGISLSYDKENYGNRYMIFDIDISHDVDGYPEEEIVREYMLKPYRYQTVDEAFEQINNCLISAQNRVKELTEIINHIEEYVHEIYQLKLQEFEIYKKFEGYYYGIKNIIDKSFF